MYVYTDQICYIKIKQTNLIILKIYLDRSMYADLQFVQI